MKTRNLILGIGWALLAGGAVSCSQPKEVRVGSLDVIPAPMEVTEKTDGSRFVVDGSTVVCYPGGNDKMKRNAEFLAGYICKLTGTEVELSTRAQEKNAIWLELDADVKGDEGYVLTVEPHRVTVKGATEAGVFYGIQTLHKALPLTGDSAVAALPCGVVKDAPRFGYRGFMVDVGRHFFSVDYLKEMIDMMALHNINYFHWHLTEDQGWRLAIGKYPKLTEVGSKRKGTIKDWETKVCDSIPVSGFYTREDAQEIVRYAAERYITVIPEIDMPGHMLAALASYPELGCTGGPYEVTTTFGVFRDVLCGGNEQSLQFAKDVMNEVMDIFPSPYIHIGGDECPKHRWKECPKCQQKIRELGLRDTKEHTKENQLQAWFMGEVEKVIRQRGRQMMAWDEILEGNPAKTTTVMAWTSQKARVRSVEKGHATIACPITNLYFSNPGYNKLRGVSSVERVYGFEPVPEGVKAEDQERILGAQGCIWTEWTKDSVKMEWQVLPRMAALAEVQWSRPERKSLDGFLKRLPHQLGLYEAWGYHYKEDIYEVNIDLEKRERGDWIVTMRTFDGAPVFYTLDGSAPDSMALLYEGPFTVQSGCIIRASAKRKGSGLGKFTEVDLKPEM